MATLLVSMCAISSAVAADEGPAAASQEAAAPADNAPSVAESPDALQSSMSARIDALIDERLDADAITPAPQSTDAEFVRRVYLDLNGRIPNSTEVRTFLSDGSPDKRSVLVDELLQRPEYARHLQNWLDTMLMRRLPQKHVKVAQWQSFLRSALNENQPWDKIVRTILSSDGADAKQRGAARFYLDRNGEVNEITRDIARVFLGADLECAQCHDHPEIGDYLQSDFHGIAAYLSRSFVFTGKDKKAIFAEKAEGEVKFKSVFDSEAEESIAKPHIFRGMLLEEVSLKKGEEYKVKPAKNVRPIPKFSRRAFLADAITNEENPRFSRNIANRVWALLLGRGIIDPIDRDHSDNPPSHPKLLDLLARQMVEHQYDLKWLIRSIVLSETYQRSSRLDDPTAEVPPDRFAQFPLKPMTPEQFAWSVLEATGRTEQERQALGEKLTEASLHKKLVGHENRFVKLFGGLPGEPPLNYESTMSQVLFLANDKLVVGLLPPSKANLTGRLLSLPADNPQAIVDELFLNVLSRPATVADHDDFDGLLVGVEGDERKAILQELVWALVTSAEFRFIH